MINKELPLVVVAGGLLTFAFAPFDLFWIAPLSYAALIYAWCGATPGRAFLLGFSFGAYLPLLSAMIAMSALGNLFGQGVLNKLSEKLFHRLFQIALTLLSLRLLYAGLTGMGYLPKI